VKPPDGSEIQAHWREAGEWWAGERPQEVWRWVDSTGVRRETLAPLPAYRLDSKQSPPAEENHREEIALRPHKVRDVKVSEASGWVPAPPSVTDIRRSQKGSGPPYAPLHVLSNYAFGRSTLFAEEIPRLAAALDLPAVALADPFSLTGAVEFAREARRCGVKPLIGASFELAEGGSLVLIARDKTGYRSLCQLISECHLSEPRLFPMATWDRLARFSRGLLCLTGGDLGPIDRALIRGDHERAAELLTRLVDLYGPSNVFVEIERSYLPWTLGVNQRLRELAQHFRLTAVAGGAITHAVRDDFPVQDVLTCAETLCAIDEIVGRKPTRAEAQPQRLDPPARALNGERFLASRTEMAVRFFDAPDLLQNTLQLADRVDDEVMPGPATMPPHSDNDPEMLREVTWRNARRLYGDRLRPRLRRRIEHELDRMIQLNFSSHFLVAWDFCQWAEERGIHYSGRGSVVDSVVAYCLGLSRIDAYAHHLHFDRFLPADGSKRPDIDIDFEAKKRQELREYLVRTYGRQHVAGISAIGAYHTRGIIREVGKVFGLSESAIQYFCKRIHGGVSPERIVKSLESRPELRSSGIPAERFQWVFRMAEKLADIPRNMRSHSSGVILSVQPLDEIAPLQWSAAEGTEEDESIDPYWRIVQWDKRSAKYFFDKFDILCLRGQDVLSGTESRMRVSFPNFDAKTISLQDEESYRAMRSGELIGIPQSASPAMRQAHVRLRTENLHDASLVQAGIRPGVGGAVKMNTLIARRRGLEPYSFEHPELENILGHTYGIVVFQEQIDQLLQSFCGYSSGEAEDIRDKIHKRRREDYGQLIRDEILHRIQSRGFSESIASHVFELIAAFKGYGFAQGHALAFADISIRSIHCQQNYPAPYFASLLSAQPAGYYGPCTLANEARQRGVLLLRPDVCKSEDDFSVEDVTTELMQTPLRVPSGAIRIALKQIAGLSQPTRSAILRERQGAPFASFFDFVSRVRPPRDELTLLILSGALDTFNPNRRCMLAAIPEALEFAQLLHQASLPLTFPEPKLPELVDFSVADRALHERRILGLDIESHLMSFERECVSRKGALSTREAKNLRPGRKAIVVGNPIRLRFPPTPSGKRVVFFDLEDEAGLLNVTCFDRVYQLDGHAIVCSPYVTLIGHAQDRDGHTAFLAKRVFPYRPRLLDQVVDKTHLPVESADFLAR